MKESVVSIRTYCIPFRMGSWYREEIKHTLFYLTGEYALVDILTIVSRRFKIFASTENKITATMQRKY